MNLKNKLNLKSQAEIIRHEDNEGMNTSERIGKMFVDLINSVSDSLEGCGKSIRFVNLNAWLFNNKGIELEQAITAVYEQHEKDEDPLGYYLAPGLVMTFFGERSREWEIWQWTGNPYSEKPDEEWARTECWKKLHPAASSGETEISLARLGGLAFDPDTGKLGVCFDNDSIKVNRTTGNLYVDFRVLEDRGLLKTINGESLFGQGDISIEGGGTGGDCLTPWQRQYLADLEESEIKSKFGVQLTLSPSSYEIDGNPVRIELKAHHTYDGKPVYAQVDDTSGSGLLFATEDSPLPTGVSVSSSLFQVPDEKKGSYTRTFSVRAGYTREGTLIQKTASATFTLYAQCRILQTEGTEAPAPATIAAAANKRRSISGTYDIPLTPGQYVWLCVPEGTGAVNTISSGGFAVPFEAAVSVDVPFGSQTVTYRCWRISGAPLDDSMRVTVN